MSYATDAQDSGAFGSGWNTTPGAFHYINEGKSVSPDSMNGVLESVRAGVPAWPTPDAVAAVLRAFAPHVPRMLAIGEENLAGREPVIPIGMIIEALGDMPLAPRRSDDDEDE